ncbi:ABC transporter permease [Spirilliplanes yamanashiensis]|uniref:ABC transporter permease n=1 Tax=Spirilliplanes yamanashiensis TaxID=42233 RepID=A0A8J3Y8D2_9ACTN|nr:ABC transporter permease [Spirilliplanes yamanashiensis]
MRARGVAVKVDTRTVAVCAGLLVALAAIALLTITSVGARLTVAGAIEAAGGGGTLRERFVLTELRLPRLVLGALVGAAFALGGAVFQSLSRNPLGSPDIIGFTTGASSGALAAILLFGAGPTGIAAGAIAGGLAAAGVVYGLASLRGGGMTRIILIGIGVSAMLLAVNNFLISRARLDAAVAAAAWLTGTLNGRGWDQVLLVVAVLVVVGPVLLSYGRRLQLLELGDEVARGVGVRVGAVRLRLVLLAVAAVAVATAAAGPVAFISLAAPQIARRLTGSAPLQLLPSALTGAVLVLAGDFAAQWLFAPAQLPVGVVTGAVGGGYLAWLLSREWRKGRTA